MSSGYIGIYSQIDLSKLVENKLHRAVSGEVNLLANGRVTIVLSVLLSLQCQVCTWLDDTAG